MQPIRDDNRSERNASKHEDDLNIKSQYSSNPRSVIGRSRLAPLVEHQPKPEKIFNVKQPNELEPLPQPRPETNIQMMNQAFSSIPP